MFSLQFIKELITAFRVPVTIGIPVNISNLQLQVQTPPQRITMSLTNTGPTIEIAPTPDQSLIHIPHSTDRFESHSMDNRSTAKEMNSEDCQNQQRTQDTQDTHGEPTRSSPRRSEVINYVQPGALNFSCPNMTVRDINNWGIGARFQVDYGINTSQLVLLLGVFLVFLWWIKTKE